MTATKNISHSVLARLKNKAKEEKVDYQLTLIRYGLERMLYRLSQSRHSDAFLLKGAMLFNLWFDMPHRPTTDVDMLGYGDHGLETLRAVFQEVCAIPCADGIVFDPETVKADEIRKESNYAGVRITFSGLINNVRCPIQVDVGYGDAVTPEALRVDYPVLLSDMPSPALRAYPQYTVVAEKTEAITSLAMANTRLKDYFDLWVLSRHGHFEGDTLQQAVAATMERRKTDLDENPIGLSDDFAGDVAKVAQWNAFIKKNKLQAPSLPEVIKELRDLLIPILSSQAAGTNIGQTWPPGGPWQ